MATERLLVPSLIAKKFVKDFDVAMQRHLSKVSRINREHQQFLEERTVKGDNIILVNAATVIEAMQEYLDKRTVGKADKVDSVSYTLDGCSGVYRFRLTERKGETK